MANILLIFSYIAKAAGFVATLNVIPFVSPPTGMVIFFTASLLKDTVNRIGDFLDNGRSDWRD
jgi:ABC-type glucose/galactose transport system permease subunit